MTELRQLHLRGATGVVRLAEFHGASHLIVPTVALMEGVIHAINSDVPEFVSAEALKASIPQWNNRPAVLGHPVREGRQISANDPTVLESHGIGPVFHAEMRGRKLYMEPYLDEDRVRRLGAGKMLERLRAGETVEVSVGAYVLTERRAGEHHGKPYKAIWTQIYPDHLAFLPNGIGACSVAMGCGTRAAEAYLVTAAGFVPFKKKGADDAEDEGDGGDDESAEGDDTTDGKDQKSKFKKFTKRQAEEYAALWATVEPKMLAAKDEHPFTYCMEHIVPAMARDGKEPDDPKAFCGYWKAEHAEAYFSAAGHAPCGCKGVVAMNKEERAATITAITTNEQSGFTAEDAKALDAMPDQSLTNLKTLAEAKAAAVKDATDEKAAREKAEAEVVTLKAAAAKVEGEKPQTEDEFLKTAPPSIRTLVERQKAADAKAKTELVAALKTAQSEFSEAELKAMEVDQLTRLAKVAKADVDFSGRGMPIPRKLEADDKNDVYANPPDPYAEALKARAAAAK